MDKNKIADIFEEIAVLLELQGENPFKIKAYTSAARFLQTGISEEELRSKIESQDLESVPGIGKAIRDKVITLYETETLPFYTNLRDKTPSGWLDMLRVPSLGAKKVKALAQQGIDDLAKLKTASEDGRVANIKGFGKKTAENILKGIENIEKFSSLFLGIEARSYANLIVENLGGLDEVQEVQIAGSLRRGKETVKDVDIICASNQPEKVMAYFVNMQQPEIQDIISQGETKSAIRLTNGLQVDLRVVSPEVYGFASIHFTGSKEHNILLRKKAHDLGYRLSEYGLESLNEDKASLNANNEIEAYKNLGLDWIDPAIREGFQELDKNVQELVTASDLKGAFHNHTTASDGHNTLEEMRAAATNMGWEYLGIADHSKASFQANGLNEERILEQLKIIEELNTNRGNQCYLFSGIECDILKDGSLDISNEVLEQLDYVVVSVHNRFGLDRDGMTQRMIKALEHPLSTMLGHMSGRLLLRREAYDIDSEKIIDCAIANGKIIELNANPYRLDMDWRLWIKAQEKGLICSINPDAHSTEQLHYVAEGVRMARKGYLSPSQVLNTFTLEKVLTYLAKNGKNR
jgi:DNA polymerase (family 10)